LRTGNIVCDHAEDLVKKALGLMLHPASHSGADAVYAETGVRYQIKGLFRAATMSDGWTHQEDADVFDALAVVIFGEDGGLERAHVVPRAVVQSRWKYGAQGKWWLDYNQEALWNASGVIDITAAVRAVVQQESRVAADTAGGAVSTTPTGDGEGVR
jgi:hypothetical protein